MRADMVRAYVEQLLERVLNESGIEPDQDGDYPIRYQGCKYFIRVLGSDSPIVQVFSVAVADVKPTAALYKELNRINATIKFARVFWVSQQILVESEMVGEGVEPVDFANACRAVATITDHFGPLLSEAFGGKTAFADEKTEIAAPPADQAIGQYL